MSNGGADRLTVRREQPAGLREEAATRPVPVPLRRNSGFRMLWIGQLLSGTGSAIAAVLTLVMPGLRDADSPPAASG